MKRRATIRLIMAIGAVLPILIYAQETEYKISYEITNYKIHVRIPDTTGRLEVSTLLSIRKVDTDPHNSLSIMLCHNFLGVKPINVHVLNEDSNPIDFQLDKDTLGVTIVLHAIEHRFSTIAVHYDLVRDEEYKGDQYVNFACEMSDTLNHINASITRTDNWYPKIEGTMHTRLAPFYLSIDVPAHFEVMASGKLMTTTSQGNRKVYEWQNYDGITDRSLYFFAAQRKRIIREYDDGFKLVMYVTDEAREDNVAYVADVIHKSYRFFEKTFGKTPEHEYKILMFPYGYSGLFKSMTAPISLFTSEIQNNEIYYPVRVVIHEVSHTWWGNLVSSNADENYWLYEGFAKYSETIGLKPALDVDVEKPSFFRLKLCCLPYLDNVRSIVDAGKEEDRFLQTTAAYHMGATYLKMLEFALGRERFFEALRDYVDTYRGKCVTTADFIAIMKKHCRANMYGIITDYLYKPGYARYILERVGTVKRRNHWRHTYELHNVGDRDIYTEYEVNTKWERYRKRLLLEKGAVETIKVESSEKEDGSLTVDPDEFLPLCESTLKGPGGMVYTNDKGEVVFFNVVENAPLSIAGIHDKMQLLKINGEELKNKDLRELNYMLIQSADTQLTLMVRDGEEEPREITVIY